MDKIEVVGFDMDYTLAIYQLLQLEELAFDLTVERMVRDRGWPERLRAAPLRRRVRHPRPGDRQAHREHLQDGPAQPRGARLPRPRCRAPGGALPGLPRRAGRPLLPPLRLDRHPLLAPRGRALRPGHPDWRRPPEHRLDYERLFTDVRESMDQIHADGTLKTRVKADLARFIVRDPELGPALHKLRSAGKRLFLLTNSHLDYTEAVMRHVLDGVLPEYPSWSNYFDAVVTAPGEAGLLLRLELPFTELDRAGDAGARARSGPSSAGDTYAGGNRGDLERLLGAGGDRVLYVGDHIYGDILRSKKSSQWRTCLVIEELEREIDWLDRHRAALEEVAGLEDLRLRVDDEAAAHRAALNADRAAARSPRRARTRPRPPLEAERMRMKRELDVLRAALRDANARDRRAAAPASSTATTATGGSPSRRGARTPGSASRSRTTPASTPAGPRTSSSTPPCSTSGCCAGPCPTRSRRSAPHALRRLARLDPSPAPARLHRSAAGRPRLVPGPVFKTGEGC